MSKNSRCWNLGNGLSVYRQRTKKGTIRYKYSFYDRNRKRIQRVAKGAATFEEAAIVAQREYRKEYEAKWEEQISQPELQGRHHMHYQRIKRIIQSYSETQEEYNELVNCLNNAYRMYNNSTTFNNEQNNDFEVEEIEIK